MSRPHDCRYRTRVAKHTPPVTGGGSGQSSVETTSTSIATRKITRYSSAAFKSYPVIYVVASPVRGHKEVPRSTGHIMVTTRYSGQQGSKSRQKVMRLYKRWHRPITKRYIKPPLLHIESSLDRLGLLSPTHDQRSQQQIGQIRSNQF